MDEEWDQIPCEIKEAFWDQLASSVVAGSDNLLPLDVYMLSKQFAQIHDVGVKTVAGDQIRGIVGLSSDFDESFTPRQQYIRHRWTNEDRARFQNAALTLINLLKIGDIYFVLDEHHRLSVASIHNQESIEAHVIEVEEDDEC